MQARQYRAKPSRTEGVTTNCSVEISTTRSASRPPERAKR
nr:MAG TPA: hypothetical protein [Caudoviricetes sp.]